MSKDYISRSKQPSILATGGNLDGVNATTYTFSSDVELVVIKNHPSSGQDIYGKFNATGASAASYDFVLEQGGEYDNIFGGMILTVGKLSLFAAGALTHGTNFFVRGHK